MGDGGGRRELRRAIRGLWGRRRRVVEAEQPGWPSARRRTLREPGGPAPLSLRPTRGAVLSVLLGCGALLAVTDLSRGLAQVQGYRPAYALPAGPFVYLNVQSLQAELRRAGVGVSGPPTRPVLTFPNAPRPVVVETGGGTPGPYLSRALVRDYGSGQVYLDANTLARSLIGAGLDVRVRGWVNPDLRVGPVTLRLGTASRPVQAYNLHSLGLAALARDLGVREAYSARWSGVNLYSTHALRAPGGAGDVYALVSVLYLPPRDPASQTSPLVLAFDLARPGVDGRLHFALPYDLVHLRLTGDPDELRQDARRFAERLDYGRAERPAHALLLRLSGDLSPGATPFTVIPRNERSVGE
ncbi:hypothetical protein [Deinococcus aestuarii]|uniref:hypothetical protein n=1 Tax=Deinococcus aestuarii TaxID=2774531 RepID=UPI001C0C0615|nr:hypothetical protein [Deinococcus aestuarii]